LAGIQSEEKEISASSANARTMPTAKRRRGDAPPFLAKK
jgi:hypothetical protein